MLPVSLAPRRGAKKMVEVEVEVPQLQQTKVERWSGLWLDRGHAVFTIGVLLSATIRIVDLC
jgi:hypothetical protein